MANVMPVPMPMRSRMMRMSTRDVPKHDIGSEHFSGRGVDKQPGRHGRHHALREQHEHYRSRDQRTKWETKKAHVTSLIWFIIALPTMWKRI